MELLACHLKPNLSPIGAAVLLNVTQALLKNAKETERHISWNV